jgi:TP53 regulating kinase and related kinases
MKEIGRGAEAIIFLDKDEKSKEDVVLKRRPKKTYRLDEIDRDLRKHRTKIEANILEKLARKGIRVPLVKKAGDRYKGADSQINDEIVMEYVEGKQVKDLLDQDVAIAERVGEAVASVHAEDIIHGDLTTSNMIFTEGKTAGKIQGRITDASKTVDGQVCLIDFGLAFHSKRIEDKAVDLHLFLQALESKHHRVRDEAWRRFKRGYGHYAQAKAVFRQLDKVEMRGRYKMKRGGRDEA